MIHFIYIYHIAYILLCNFVSSPGRRRSSKFLLPSERKFCRETGTKVDVVTRHQYGIPAPGFHTPFRWETSGSVAKCRLFFQTKSYSHFFSNISRMKRIRWLTNVMGSYRGWRKKVKSYLRIWRMKERLMTRSGKYHGNPLNKYDSWGGGVLNKVLYVFAPLQGPTPYPFIYYVWQKMYPFRTTFHRQMVLLWFTYFELM